MIGWLYLAGAIVLEIAATVLLKMSDGLRYLHLAALSILLYCACFLLLAPALKLIPIGIAYSIWAGIGIVSVSVLGAILFGQRLDIVQVGFIALILVGAVGLQLSTLR